MEIRLQKFMAGCGVASRRACEKLIAEGRVTVNGAVVTELGAKVDDAADAVCVDGKHVQAVRAYTYVLLHKPVGYVTTASDQFGRPAVTDLVKDVPARLYPVGRLDYDTSGLLILTDDGDLTFKLTHPKHEARKVYIARISGIPKLPMLEMFRKGLLIDGKMTAPAAIEVLHRQNGNAEVRVTIREGRNRQVRKMLAAIGHEVTSLARVQMGGLSLGDLKVGAYRHLTEEEVERLKS